MNTPITGYAEGYYGRLLDWSERLRILKTLQALGMNTYYYAPKEDPWHRFDWRIPYPDEWHAAFRQFCNDARLRGVQVVAGVAPGLDFDFSQFPDSADFKLLVSKCALLLADGANHISLLMDDIDADFLHRCGDFTNEGQAHAALANALGEALGLAPSIRPGTTDDNTVDTFTGASSCIWVTPRIYADELIAGAPDYIPAFIDRLDARHKVLYCGSDVVPQTLNTESVQALCIEKARTTGKASSLNISPKHQIIIWDNLYANDYCPRRLFVGSWRERINVNHVLLNPTGMINTDCLLLQLMADGLSHNVYSEADHCNLNESWRNTLKQHGVPDAFFHIAPYFDLPIFNSSPESQYCVDDELIREAIEHCLWRWKSPLSREWYAAIFGLKHDLMTRSGEHTPLRIRKTQNAPLAEHLLNSP